MKRSLSILSLFVLLFVVWMSRQIKAPPFYLTEEEKNAYVIGEVTNKEYKQNQISIYISNIEFLEFCEVSQNLNHIIKNEYENLGLNSDVGCICYLDEFSVEPNIGETIILTGNMEDFYPASNLGMFDQKEYYEEKGIHFLLFQGVILEQDGEINRLKEGLFSIRKKMLGILLEELGEENAGILATMLLGDREYLTEEIKEAYQYSGISHILAISGLHISILGYGIFSLCRKTRMPSSIGSLLTALFLIIYGIMVGGSVSTMRASIMFLIFMGGKVTKRPYDLLTALAVSAAIITLINQGNLDAGFYLSFGAVMGLTFMAPFLSTLISWKKKGFKNQVIKSILAGSSIFLATAPILMYYFYGLAPLSILANLIVIPLMSILIVSGLGLIMTSMSLNFLVPICREICESILLLYKKISNVSEIIPGYFIVTGKPELWRIIIYYLGLCVLLFVVELSRKNKVHVRIHRGRYKILNYNLIKKGVQKKNRKWIVLIYFLLLFSLLYIQPQRNVQVEVLDVGQGDGIYIDTGTGYSLFIDGGSTTVKDFGKYRLAPYLKAKGVRKIDYLFITHYDSDHISGWVELLGEMVEKEGKAEILELTNIVISEETKNCEGGEELLELVRELDIQIYTMEQGDVMDFSGVSLRCIYPGEILTDSANANSLTLLLTKDDFSILFTGDLEGEGENLVASQLKDLYKEGIIDSIEVLKVGHHGSKQASSLEFLEIVNADLGVISYGRNNTYGHPADEVLERLEELDMIYLGTGNVGAILIESDGRKYWVETFN